MVEGYDETLLLVDEDRSRDRYSGRLGSLSDT